MLRQLFFRSDALTRQLSAPLVDERDQYLAHWAAQGMSRSTLRAKARLLLSIARYLRLAERSSDTISLPEIERAVTRWSNHNRPSIKTGRGEFSKQYFITEASRWLAFLNRLHLASESVTAFDGMVAEFRNFMVEDRGLSSSTVEFRCKSVRPFLNRLLDRERSLEAITASDVDTLLAEKVNEEHYARISIRGYASSLRAFFRYAESRGWCRRGIAASIMAPRVFQQETLPSGPSWEVVRDILGATAGDHPTTIRDHAMLQLFALYGVRSQEVARLQLSDIDWQQDRIFFTRSKGAGRHEFPLLPAVGTAIIRYLKEARPKSPRRQIFLTTVAPIGPLSRGAIWFAVSRRLRERRPCLGTSDRIRSGMLVLPV